MTDIKIAQPRRARRTTKKTQIRRGPSTKMWVYENRFEYGIIAAGTSGSIAFVASPSIQNGSEYTSLQSIFGEVKLLSAFLTLTTRSPAVTSIFHGSVLVGTNMAMNGTTFTTPASITAVQNLEKKAEYSTSSLEVHRYKMRVPRRLEFTGITNDIPTIPLPYAGSPGMIIIWGDNLTPSTSYFVAHLTTRHLLRSRN